MFRLALSLCPAVAVTTTVMNGVILGVAVLLVQVLSSVTVALARGMIHPRVRIPVYTIIIAVWVSVIDMTLAAFVPALYAQVGLYVKLIVAFAIIISRLEVFASRQPLVAVVLGRPRHGARVPARAGRRSARSASCSATARSLGRPARARQAAAVLRAAGRRVLLDRAADGVLQLRSSARFTGRSPAPARAAAMRQASDARPCSCPRARAAWSLLLAALARVARLAPAPARRRRTSIRAARVLAPNHVRVELARPPSRT